MKSTLRNLFLAAFAITIVVVLAVAVKALPQALTPSPTVN